ncbi:MAG: phosphate acetyltransferase [Rhodobacterales bacterium]|nr:MAG: phosphate acetyltransferase [Rhodobacterales bacterium]
MSSQFLSPHAPSVPQGLMDQAKSMTAPRVALVNAGAVNPLEGIRESAEAGLADPILIGDEAKIRATAEEIGWDIGGIRVVDAPGETAAPEAARMAREGEADAIMKGQLHTSVFLKGLLPSSAGLRESGVRCGHVFHITVPGSDRPLLLTDAALNVDPSIETRQACLMHAIDLAHKLGVKDAHAAILSANEDPIPSIQNSMDAAAISAWAVGAVRDATVAGPMAMDLILSKKAAEAKGYDSPVAGDADIILTPNITTGNAVFKLMVLGLGACAAGLVLGAKVPILLTSRSQGAAARVATAALAVVASGAEG